MKVIEKIVQMGEDLKMLQGQDRLQYLVDKAREVEPLPESVKTEENRIHGCASKLWIIGGADPDGGQIDRASGSGTSANVSLSKGFVYYRRDPETGRLVSEEQDLLKEDLK